MWLWGVSKYIFVFVHSFFFLQDIVVNIICSYILITVLTIPVQFLQKKWLDMTEILLTFPYNRSPNRRNNHEPGKSKTNTTRSSLRRPTNKLMHRYSFINLRSAPFESFFMRIAKTLNRLIRVFAGRTSYFVGLVVLWLS